MSDEEGLCKKRLDGVALGVAIAGEHVAIALTKRSLPSEHAIDIRGVRGLGLVRRLVSPTMVIRLVLAPGARYVAAPGAGLVWDCESRDVVLETPQSRSCICEFSESGRRFAATCADGKLRIWRLPDARRIATLEVRRHIRAGGSPHCLAFSKDERTPWVGCGDGAVLAFTPAHE